MQNQTADVTWKENGVPVSVRFDDPYFSLDNGLAETRHVFLHGNGLPDRFHDGFAIAELGFGTGLNFLTTLAAWRASGQVGTLRFTSFEAFPMTGDDLWLALSRFPEVRPLAEQLVSRWSPSGGVMRLGEDAVLDVVIGDARAQLPAWDQQADAWYLDGFSPAKNPELWAPDLMGEVARHTRPGGTFATYTAAGFVRRALADAGFDVERAPGYGRKRHMSRGVKRA